MIKNESINSCYIQDLVNIYKHFIFSPELPSGFYNAGFENLKIIDIAKKVADIIPSKIVIKKKNDIRYYSLNWDKILSSGFVKQFSVVDAIKEIKEKYESKKFKGSSRCYTVKWMKKINL